jgi:hypothetical protein
MRYVILLLLQATAATGEIRGKITFKTADAERRFVLAGGTGVGISAWGVDDVGNIEALKHFSGRSFGRLTFDAKAGFSYRIPDLPEGKVLVYVAWKRMKQVGDVRREMGTHYLDWKWIEVKPIRVGDTVPEIPGWPTSAN